MSRQTVLRSMLILLGVGAFGVLDALVKGHHGETRNAIGNISAPWAVLPLLAGAFVLPHRPSLGAFVGAISSVATFVSYALERAGAMSIGGRGGLVVAVSNRWLITGIIGGAALGAGGAWLTNRGRWGAIISIVASLFVLEPAGRLLWAITKSEPIGLFVPDPIVWSVEVLFGCLLAVGGIGIRRSWHHPI